MKKHYIVSLTGNPNTGKTSLFNALTGEHAHVGNWPGVTVEKKEGLLLNNDNMKISIVDLPGIYSLRTNSEDELVASNFLIEDNPDLSIVVLDASRLERSLYLFMQIRELGQKTVVILNMNDIAKSSGITINENKLSELLGCPVIKTVATEKIDLEHLRKIIIETIENDQKIISTEFRESVKRALTELTSKSCDINSKMCKYNVAIKIAEKDNKFLKHFLNDSKVASLVESIQSNDLQRDIIEDRWNTIKSITNSVTKREQLQSKFSIISDKIDRIAINKYFGLPIFFGTIFLMFVFVYTIGNPIVGLLEKTIEIISGATAKLLISYNSPELLTSLIVDGILGGVGAVIVFFPNIFLLFMFLGFLEDSGYLSRGTFVMDRLMNAIGLHGKSFIPLIMGFGCSIPAMIGTRIMEKKKDKFLTMLVVPFISCSARLPVFILFTGTFFKEKAALVIFFLYLIGIVVAIIVAKVLSMTLFKGTKSLLVMELPAYHVPSIKNILKSAWTKSAMFLKNAATFIALTVVVIWALGNLPYGVEYASKESYIGIIGSKLIFLFKGTGYGFWQATVALLSGFLAKESIIGTLGALFANESGSLGDSLTQYFTPLTAFSYLVMILLYTPCISSVATFKNESGSWKWTIFLTVYTFLVALIISTLVYQVGKIFFTF